MSDLALMIIGVVRTGIFGFGTVVNNKTGLTGKYDYTLKYAYDRSTAAGLEGAGGSDDSAPVIFTAVQEQLGLRLEPFKGEAQFLVIDHIERPSEN